VIGLRALEFEKKSPGLPLHDTNNLKDATARLLVIKRHAPTIRKFINDMNKIQTPLTEIPALIVDADGSALTKGGAMEKLIAELKNALPRAQHVTFASLAPTEADAPKDFVMSLPTPAEVHT
jgi:hypothetical protein